MYNVLNYSIDTKKKFECTSTVQQYDFIEFRFSVKNNDIELDLTDININFIYVNANKTLDDDFIISKNGSNITIQAKNNNCTKSTGMAKFQITFIKNGSQISTFPFSLFVNDAVTSDGGVSETILTAFEELKKLLSESNLDGLKARLEQLDKDVLKAIRDIINLQGTDAIINNSIETLRELINNNTTYIDGVENRTTAVETRTTTVENNLGALNLVVSATVNTVKSHSDALDDLRDDVDQLIAGENNVDLTELQALRTDEDGVEHASANASVKSDFRKKADKADMENKLNTHLMVIGNVANEVLQLQEDTKTELGGSFKARTIAINTFLFDHMQDPNMYVSGFNVTRLDSTRITIDDVESANVYFYGSKNGRDFTFKTDVPLEDAFTVGSGRISDVGKVFDFIMFTGLVIKFKKEEDIRYVKYHVERDPDAPRVMLTSVLYKWNEYEENSDPQYNQYEKFNSQKGRIYGLDYDNPPTFDGYSHDFEYLVPHEVDYKLKEEVKESRGGWAKLDYRLDYMENTLDMYKPLFALMQDDINDLDTKMQNNKDSIDAITNLFTTVFMPRLKAVEQILGINHDDGHAPPTKPRPNVAWEHLSYQSTGLTCWFYTNDIDFNMANSYDMAGAGLTENQQANSGMARTYYQYNWGHARTAVCLYKTDMQGWNDGLTDVVKIALFNSWWINNVNWLG